MVTAVWREFFWLKSAIMLTQATLWRSIQCSPMLAARARTRRVRAMRDGLKAERIRRRRENVNGHG
jgi:hypothetical protein